MSDSPEPTPTGSQLACYCTELERLASTVIAMLSQCKALGSPLAEDRPSVERLVPIAGNLQNTIVAALTADAEATLQGTLVADSAPIVKTTGARFIEWHKGNRETPDGVVAEGDDGRLPVGAGETDEGDDKRLPSVDRCAEILMTDLSSACSDGTDDKSEITLQGTNASLPLPSVFQFLGQTKKSGTLRVKTNHETMRFEVVHGDLVFSTTDNSPHDQLLGEILIDLGFVPRDVLEAALTRIGEGKTRLGTLLEEEQLVSLDDLRHALKAQIQNRLERAFEAPESAFTFSEGAPERPHHRIKMNVTHLLLESL